jgi:hypothetical protein
MLQGIKGLGVGATLLASVRGNISQTDIAGVAGE